MPDDRYCERSEAIQRTVPPARDCFVAPLGLLAMTNRVAVS